MLRRLFPSLPKLVAAEGAAASAHRPFIRRDSERLRWTVDGSFVLPRDNPGIRVEPNFVTEAEAAEVAAAMRTTIDAYGYSYDGDTRAHLVSPDSGAVERDYDGAVNNERVTGRVERPDLGQVVPPWGYGDDFVPSALPPALAGVALRIAQCGAFAVGRQRDVTINARSHSFFQLDPHVDPPSDGPDVFILSLGSSVVLTFTPPPEELEARGLPPRRRDHGEVGLRSWSDADIDVLVQPRTLLHFTGAARDGWSHAIRAGVAVDVMAPAAPAGGDAATAASAAAAPAVCDWWGATDYLLRREPHRLSLVLAFGGAAVAAPPG